MNAGPAPRLSTWRATSAALSDGLSLDAGIFGQLREHDFARARIGLRRFAWVKHPDLVDHVLHAGRSRYVKSAEYEPIRAAAGINLLTDEGDSWAHHRGAVNQMFARRHLDSLIHLMVDPVHAMTDDYAERAATRPVELDLHEEMVEMTLRVVANALFSQDFGQVVGSMHDVVTKGMRIAEVLDRLTLVGVLDRRSWDALAKVARGPVPVPPPFAVLREVGRGLDDAVNSVVDERISTPTDTPDLLNLLLTADDGGWSRQRVRDEALTFMLAGHETTANAMAWFWYLMGRNPDAYQTLLDEVDAVVGSDRPGAGHLSGLTWTQACLQESQRYYSAVPMLARTAVEDDMIGTHRIRTGTTVIIPVHAIHHDERFWERPEEFDPTRFLPGAGKTHRSSFLPFGGGRRVCIGQSFAMMEMLLIIATLSQRLRFDLVPGHRVSPEVSLTLRPREGVRMRAVPR